MFGPGWRGGREEVLNTFSIIILWSKLQNGEGKLVTFIKNYAVL